MTQEMTARLNDLDQEIRNLGQVMLRLRYDDLKATFCEQMKKAVEDYSLLRLHPDVDLATAATRCPNREECGPRLRTVVTAAAKALREDRPDEAMSLLEETEELIRSDRTPCHDQGCTASAIIVLERARTAVELFEAMRERLSLPSSPPSAPLRTSPQEAAASLDPLSHPKRLEILELLARGERSFTEIGQAVGLKTGHLQFHLRPLLEHRLVEGKGRGRTYRLTVKGEQALAGVADLMGRLRGVERKDGAGTEI